MSLPVENAVTLVLVSLGFVSLLVMLVFECWRPGLTHQPGGRGRPRNLNRECCSVVLGDAMLVPLLIIFALGLLIFASAAQEDLCDTSLGYCDTISCVAGNVIWQGCVNSPGARPAPPNIAHVRPAGSRRCLLFARECLCVRLYHSNG